MEAVVVPQAEAPPENYRRPKLTTKFYIQKFTRIVTGKDWKQVVRVALTQALEGDYRARDWLTSIIMQIKDHSSESAGNALAAAAMGKDLKVLLKQVTKTVELSSKDKAT